MTRTAGTETLHGVRIVGMRRMNSRPSGSPRWLVAFSDGTEADTGDGASCSWSIDNAEYRNVPLEVELRGGSVVKVRRTMPVVHIADFTGTPQSLTAQEVWRSQGFAVTPAPQDQQ